MAFDIGFAELLTKRPSSLIFSGRVVVADKNTRPGQIIFRETICTINSLNTPIATEQHQRQFLVTVIGFLVEVRRSHDITPASAERRSQRGLRLEL